MMKNIIKFWFFISILLIVYLIGWNSNKYQIFPYAYIQNNIYNLKLLFNNLGHSNSEIENDYYCNENFKSNKNFEQVNYLLVFEKCPKIYLLDNNAKIKKIWDLTKILPNKYKNEGIYPFNAIYQKNSNLIFSFSSFKRDKNYIGLINIDENKYKLEWIKKHQVHHWGSIDENFIYMPTEKRVRLKEIEFFNSKCVYIHHYQTISLFDLNTGNIISEIDLLKKINEFDPNILNEYKQIKDPKCDGPLHINYSRITSNDNLTKFNLPSKNNLLISDRSLDIIYIYNIDEGKILDSIAGYFSKQHYPIILKNGNIAVFDNEGSDIENGRSRIAIINPKDRPAVKFIRGNDEHFFQSDNRGHVQAIDNTFFISSSVQGKIFYSICNDAVLDCKIDILFNFKQIVEDLQIIKVF